MIASNSQATSIMHQNNIWMKSSEIMALSNPNLGASTGQRKILTIEQDDFQTLCN